MRTFPPTEYGRWRALDRQARRAWLRRACRAHFAEGREHRTGQPGEVFTIEGRDIHDLWGFFCAMGEAVNGPGGYFGASAMSFDDCLFGGFGLEAPATIVWKSSGVSKKRLGNRVLAAYCTQVVAWIDSQDTPSDYDAGRAWAVETLDQARRGRTMFETLVSTIESVESRTMWTTGRRIEVILQDSGESTSML